MIVDRDVWLPTEKLSNMGVEVFQFHVDDVPSANIAPFFRSPPLMPTYFTSRPSLNLIINNNLQIFPQHFRPVADIVQRSQQCGGLLVLFLMSNLKFLLGVITGS